MKAILPGSYDPITLGHLDIVRRACEIYDEIYVVAFINPQKKYMFTPDDRLKMLSLATEDIPGVKVDFSDGRVVDYMRDHGIDVIVKGYRNEVDLEYERLQAEYNLANGGYKTELILASEKYGDISSTLARDLIKRGADLNGVLPEKVISFIKEN
jgi:pantetheine-phosphate adenylyltransferase